MSVNSGECVSCGWFCESAHGTHVDHALVVQSWVSVRFHRDDADLLAGDFVVRRIQIKPLFKIGFYATHVLFACEDGFCEKCVFDECFVCGKWKDVKKGKPVVLWSVEVHQGCLGGVETGVLGFDFYAEEVLFEVDAGRVLSGGGFERTLECPFCGEVAFGGVYDGL